MSQVREALKRADDERQAVKRPRKRLMDDIKDLGSKPLPKEERDKVVAQARKIISATPGKDKKIVALSLLAAQVAHAGDKDLADEIMRDAERLVNPQPKNYQDFLLQLDARERLCRGKSGQGIPAARKYDPAGQRHDLGVCKGRRIHRCQRRD